MNRRSLLTSALLVLAARRLPLPVWTSRAEAQEKRASLVWRHGVSPFGDLKYPSGFKQFDYVNANAPKGGAARQIALGTYDNFNMVVDGVKGALAVGIDLNYDTLLVAALDEVSSGYGLLAEAVSYPDDFSSASFELRAEAKWHDGSRGHAGGRDIFLRYVQETQSAGRRQLPARRQGRRRPAIAKSPSRSMGPATAPCRRSSGSSPSCPRRGGRGPTRTARNATWARPRSSRRSAPAPTASRSSRPAAASSTSACKDYWGHAVNVNIGRDNFDELRFEYFRDGTVALEAFKADAVDWRIENSAKNWATAYDFPAVTDKRVLLEEFPIKNVGMMQALRLQSAPREIPGPARAACLQLRVRFRGDEQADLLRPVQTHRQLFRRHRPRGDRPARRPRTRTPGDGARQSSGRCVQETLRQSGRRQSRRGARQSAHEAVRLFKEAGYDCADQQLVHGKTGEPFAVELLGANPTVRARLPVLQALARAPRHQRDGAHGRCGAI